MNVQRIGLEILGTCLHVLNIVPLVDKLGIFLGTACFTLQHHLLQKLLVSRVIDSDTILLILF